MRGEGSTTDYFLKDGRRRWRYAFDGDPVPGKPRNQQTKKGFLSKRAAVAAMQAAMVRHRAGDDREPSREPTQRYLERWLEATSPGRRPSTTQGYARCLRRLFPLIGTVRLDRLRPLDIQQAYATLAEGDPAGAGTGLAPSTLQQTHTVLAMALKQAVRWRELRESPTSGVRVPAGERTVSPATSSTKVLFWTPAQCATFLAATQQGDPRHALWRLLLDSGMRIGEALALGWADVDLTARVVRVERTVTLDAARRFIVGNEAKTMSSRRTIPVSAATARALERHRLAQIERRLGLGPAWHDSGLVFDRGDGALLLPPVAARHLAAAIAGAELPRLSFHGFRRSMTSTWLLAGKNPKVVAERLGHTDVAFTLNVYAKIHPDWHRADTDDVQAFLDAAAR